MMKLFQPYITDTKVADLLYKRVISDFQSKRHAGGKIFESQVQTKLNEYSIPFKKQMWLDTNGIIVTQSKKKNPAYHIVDFVIGSNIQYGDHISKHIVVSCKTSCRDRWSQDSFMMDTHIPKAYYLVTKSKDYPSPLNFQESATRKIVTEYPKKKDVRQYKLNSIDDLCNDLRDCGVITL